MSDEQYTPTPGDMRRSGIRHDYAMSGPGTYAQRVAEFDRMIADVARRAKAEALREAADGIRALHPGETKASAIWLDARADRIETEMTP